MSKHLQNEIEKLQKTILALCTMVEEQLAAALKSVIDKDDDLATLVISKDKAVDNTEIDVEEECLKILALHQPVAVDLRFIIAALKINNDLERIGDLAVNIAERGRSIALNGFPLPDFDFNRMFDKAISMLKKSIDALINWDVDLAVAVCASDDEIDELNRTMFSHFKETVCQKPGLCDAMLDYLSVSRYLERVADHATNVAEDVMYMIEGDIVRHGKKES
ncbi:MAG: phosphate signaling complex protein PhoU [Chitinivibrionales bacterium]|nr:phosphate signaling complex protein PhoU [Chitinivibrionales bacterium]